MTEKPINDQTGNKNSAYLVSEACQVPPAWMKMPSTFKSYIENPKSKLLKMAHSICSLIDDCQFPAQHGHRK
jgi:hypothetical protein